MDSPNQNTEEDAYLYGFPENEILNKACTEWHSFAFSFTECWKKDAGHLPDRKIIMKARRMWSMYSMTGYEAYQTIIREMKIHGFNSMDYAND